MGAQLEVIFSSYLLVNISIELSMGHRWEQQVSYHALSKTWSLETNSILIDDLAMKV